MEKLKNYYAEARRVLMDVIPLEKPLCLSIEPTNLCNFKCTMCFHGNNEYAEDAKPLKNMDMNCFNKIIDDIKNWGGDRIKLIKLYSLGEPLLHPAICEMVKIIKEANICDKIEITTNASLLTKEISEKLVEYGLDILRISVYGADSDHMKEITKSNFSPEDIKRNVKYLKNYREHLSKKTPIILAKMLNTYTDENEKFIKMYTDVADMVGIDEPFHLPNCEYDIFENLYHENATVAYEGSMGTNIYRQEKVCRYPFTHMTIRNDGSCVVCCADWLKELNFGNVNKNTIQEIWMSKSLYDIRCKMLKTKGKCFKACDGCEIPLRDSEEDSVDDLEIEKLSYKYMI